MWMASGWDSACTWMQSWALRVARLKNMQYLLKVKTCSRTFTQTSQSIIQFKQTWLISEKLEKSNTEGKTRLCYSLVTIRKE